MEKAIKEKPSEKEWNEHMHKAGDWLTCAIGERKELLEIRGVKFGYKGAIKRPVYSQFEILAILGMKFCNRVGNDEYQEALSILDQIDAWIDTHPVVIKEEQECLEDPTQVNSE